MRRVCFGIALLLLVAIGIGCNSKPRSNATGNHAEHQEDHLGHDHDHGDEGPHGGHLVELDNDSYHAEWTHDDTTGKVVIYILDGEAKSERPIAADRLTIKTQVKEGEANSYELVAVKASDAEQATAQFEIISPELAVALLVAGNGAEASLEFTVDGQTIHGSIEHHEHEGHQH